MGNGENFGSIKGASPVNAILVLTRNGRAGNMSRNRGDGTQHKEQGNNTGKKQPFHVNLSF